MKAQLLNYTCAKELRSETRLLSHRSTIVSLKKQRIVRDPIHGFISLSHYDFIQELVDTQYFQRLRRLCQLGVSAYVYPSATHNRLSHVLGAMELFTKLFDNLKRSAPSSVTTDKLEELRKLGIASTLLHDIGHGPFSHASEHIFNFKHEDMTNAIIRETEVSEILSRSGIKPSDVTDIIEGTSPQENRIIMQLTSSQLDVDRLDYLARDMYFTGVGFGGIDSHRIIRMMKIYNNPGSDIDGYAVTEQGGLYSLESYILSRHLMHQAVYFHKATRCVELLMEKLFQRAKWLAREKKMQLPEEIQFLTEKRDISWKDTFALDDSVLYSIILRWTKNEDSILSNIAKRIINRDLLKVVELPQRVYGTYVQKMKQIEKNLSDSGFDPQYYTMLDGPKHIPYAPYSPKSPEDKKTVITNIFVLDYDGQPKEISNLSPTVRAIAEYQYSYRVYVPDKCRPETLSILSLKGG